MGPATLTHPCPISSPEAGDIGAVRLLCISGSFFLLPCGVGRHSIHVLASVCGIVGAPLLPPHHRLVPAWIPWQNFVGNFEGNFGGNFEKFEFPLEIPIEIPTEISPSILEKSDQLSASQLGLRPGCATSWDGPWGEGHGKVLAVQRSVIFAGRRQHLYSTPTFS